MKDKEKLPHISRYIEMALFNVYEHLLTIQNNFPFPLEDLYCFYLLIEKYITLKTSIPGGEKRAQLVISYIKKIYPKAREQLRWVFIVENKKNIKTDSLYIINRLDYILAIEGAQER